MPSSARRYLRKPLPGPVMLLSPWTVLALLLSTVVPLPEPWATLIGTCPKWTPTSTKGVAAS